MRIAPSDDEMVVRVTLNSLSTKPVYLSSESNHSWTKNYIDIFSPVILKIYKEGDEFLDGEMAEALQGHDVKACALYDEFRKACTNNRLTRFSKLESYLQLLISIKNVNKPLDLFTLSNALSLEIESIDSSLRGFMRVERIVERCAKHMEFLTYPDVVKLQDLVRANVVSEAE